MKSVAGGILMGVGILISGASGLCSAAIFMSSGEFGGPEMWPLVLLFGGVPFALGLGLFLWGRSLNRRAGEKSGDSRQADGT